MVLLYVNRGVSGPRNRVFLPTLTWLGLLQTTVLKLKNRMYIEIKNLNQLMWQHYRCEFICLQWPVFCKSQILSWFIIFLDRTICCFVGLFLYKLLVYMRSFYPSFCYQQSMFRCSLDTEYEIPTSFLVLIVMHLKKRSEVRGISLFNSMLGMNRVKKLLKVLMRR